MNLEQGSQTIDLLGFARRRGKLAAVVASVFLLVTYWISMALPNLYSSSATILAPARNFSDWHGADEI